MTLRCLTLAGLLATGAVVPAWGQRPAAASAPATLRVRDEARLGSAVALQDPPDIRALLAQAQNWEQKLKDSEALAYYQKILSLNAQHYQSLWRAAVLSIHIGGRYADERRKAAYYASARQYATRALALQPEGGESNYALALALFSEASLQSARDRLRLFKDLRSCVYLAAERRPDLSEAWQLYGRWHYRVAHYSLLEKLYSRLVLGGPPPGASVATARQALEKARALDPARAQYAYDLARVYKYEGERERAIALLRTAIQLPTITAEDLTVNRLCQQLLEPLARAQARDDRQHARWYARRRK